MLKQQWQKYKKYTSFRIVLFLLCLALIWLPIAIPLNAILHKEPNLSTIATMGLLLIQFILLQKLWGTSIYRQPLIFQEYGFKCDRLGITAFIQGLAIGFIFCSGLFITQAIFGWLTISNSEEFLLKIVIEGLLSATGIAFAEELVFRGWILVEIEKDFSKNTGLWCSSILFAVAHFLKPISEIIRTSIAFPALLILGLSLVWAKRAYSDRLSISVGIHGGLVWSYYILNVGNLITYTDRVPEWITGIDGNPIAGVFGLSWMGVLALMMRSKAVEKLAVGKFN